MSVNTNDISVLVDKIERRLGLLMLTPHLPENLGKKEWVSVIENDTMTAGYGYYVPEFGGYEDTLTSFMQFQQAADISSMYNNQIFVEFTYPNKLWIGRAGNIDVNLKSFVVELLVQHTNLQTISPTMMETFEALAQCDVARFLVNNLQYVDGLETAYMQIDLKLDALRNEAEKRDNVIETLQNSYVSASNDAIPYIITVSG